MVSSARLDADDAILVRHFPSALRGIKNEVHCIAFVSKKPGTSSDSPRCAPMNAIGARPHTMMSNLPVDAGALVDVLFSLTTWIPRYFLNHINTPSCRVDVDVLCGGHNPSKDKHSWVARNARDNDAELFPLHLRWHLWLSAALDHVPVSSLRLILGPPRQQLPDHHPCPCLLMIATPNAAAMHRLQRFP